MSPDDSSPMPANEHDRRPGPRRQRAHRHQRVHRGRSVPQVHPRCPVKPPTAPEHDRRGEHCHHPFPAVELQRRNHRQGDDRDTEHQRDDPATPQVGFASTLRSVVVSGNRGDVSQPFDDGAHVGLGGAVMQHGRTAIGEVDAHLVDPVELAEAALDPVRAGRTGHPFDGDVGTHRCRSGTLCGHEGSIT